MRVTLRPVQDGDEPFLLRVYASTRAEELAPVPWTPDQKTAFVAQQFAAQTSHYAQHYPGMSADVILLDGAPAGRLLVARWPDEMRIVDISILPEFRGRGAGSEQLLYVVKGGASRRRRRLRAAAARPSSPPQTPAPALSTVQAIAPSSSAQLTTSTATGLIGTNDYGLVAPHA